MSAVRRLILAVELLDAACKDPNGVETGAVRDAREWLEEAAREVVSVSSYAAEHRAFEAWWPTVGQTIGKVAAWEAWKARAGITDSSDPVTAYYADRANSGLAALTGK